MARYFKMYVYVVGEDYETRETLIDESTFRKYQRAIVEGNTHLVLEDKIMKVSSIKEILPADDIVNEYLAMGVKLKELGLKESPLLEKKKVYGELKKIDIDSDVPYLQSQ
jgi:hypothetical protein